MRDPFVVLACLAALAIAGCSTDSEQSIAASDGIELSDALAYRADEPTISVVSPAPGATVFSPVTVEVETTDLRISPAGETRDGEGHLHVLIDQGCLEPGVVIPSDERTVHVGDGSTSFALELTPGRHELCVQVGDGFHIAVAIYDRLTITVLDELRGSLRTEGNGY